MWDGDWPFKPLFLLVITELIAQLWTVPAFPPLSALDCSCLPSPVSSGLLQKNHWNLSKNCSNCRLENHEEKKHCIPTVCIRHRQFNRGECTYTIVELPRNLLILTLFRDNIFLFSLPKICENTEGNCSHKWELLRNVATTYSISR